MDANEIASCIMKRFKDTNSDVNHVIDQRWLTLHFLQQLNPKEKDLFPAAIDTLENNGYITVTNRAGMVCLVLTQKGFDYIYPCVPNEVIKKIQKLILNEFEARQSRAGHCIDQRWFLHQLLTSLNPAEKKYIEDAINNLVEQGIIICNPNDVLRFLVLTEKGYELLY